MRDFAPDQGVEPEANLSVLLRIRQRRAGAKDPLAVGVLFFNGLLVGCNISALKKYHLLTSPQRRATFARISSAAFTHLNGLGSALCASKNSRIASSSSRTL